MLHISPVLITVLLASAVLFLPGNAFAEKNDPNGPKHSHNVQKETPSAKVENPSSHGRIPVKGEMAQPVPNLKANNPSRNVIHPLPKQAAAKKIATTPKTLPEQAKGHGYGLSRPNKMKKTVQAASNLNSVGEKESKSKSKRVSKTSAANEQEHKAESSKMVKHFVPKEEKVVRTERLVSVPLQKGETPASKNQIPTDNQAVNPTQRSSSSESPTHERVSSYINTISFVDKWFEWNKYDEINFVQPFLSRYALKNHQWMNAPPSPPPQETPFIKTVNVS